MRDPHRWARARSWRDHLRTGDGGVTRRQVLGAGAAAAGLAAVSGASAASAKSRPHRRVHHASSVTPTAALITRKPLRNGLTEFTLRGLPLPGAGENPFDASQFDVPVTFTGPDGRHLATTAFWHESGSWRARLLAEIRGRWKVRVDDGPARSFVVAASTLPAVVRRSGNRLVHADGSPYIALGENLGWAGEDPSTLPDVTPTYQRWHSRLGAVGASWTRLWMANWSFGLEWSDTPLGDYRGRLARAALLDAVLADGAAHGILAQLVLQHHGPFSTDTDSQWAENPYNAALGGPQQNAGDVWTNATTAALFRQRFRYIISRFWAQPGLLAWELWNEFTLVDSGTTQAAVDWHQAMSAYVRGLDPLGRPITTSYGWLGDTPEGDIDSALGMETTYPPVWDIADIDIVQPHVYLGFGAPLPVDPTSEFALALAGLRAHGKPILLGEADIDTAGPDAALDPTGSHLIDIAWGGLFTTSAGSGMPWWWDVYVDDLNLYGRLAGAFAFARANASIISGATPSSVTVPGLRPLLLWQLQNGASGAIWVRNARDRWNLPDNTAIAKAVIPLPAGAGSTITFWSTDTGAQVGSATASGGRVTLPSFARSVALTYAP